MVIIVHPANVGMLIEKYEIQVEPIYNEDDDEKLESWDAISILSGLWQHEDTLLGAVQAVMSSIDKEDKLDDYILT